MSPPVLVNVWLTARDQRGRRSVGDEADAELGGDVLGGRRVGGEDVEHPLAVADPEARRQRVAEHRLRAVVVVGGAEVEGAGASPPCGRRSSSR